jgi:hypothetical protein
LINAELGRWPQLATGPVGMSGRIRDSSTLAVFPLMVSFPSVGMPGQRNTEFFAFLCLFAADWTWRSYKVAVVKLWGIATHADRFTYFLGFSSKIGPMNVYEPVRALNRRAARERWFYFCDHQLTFSNPWYDTLLNLWRTKSNGRPMPRRSDITPRDLKDVLRNIIVFERTSCNPSRYGWRLIGTSLTGITGHNTGKTFDETLPADHVARWVECGDIILNGGQPLRFVGRVHLKGHEYLDAENLFVPLANNNDEPTFVMGLCRYTPRRSEDEESWENQIASVPGGLL